uniref:DNA helicase n=1 Tax=Strongyloides papillosus TaxID=174720 RepID=A0A0N5C616_STREA
MCFNDSQFIDVESNFDDVCMIDDDNITVEEVQTLEESDFEEEELLPDEININKILIEKQLHKNTSFMAAYFEKMFSKLVLENPSAPFTLIESFMDMYGDCLDMFAPIEIVQTYNKSILKKKILRRNEINIQGIELMEPEEENDNEGEYIEAFNCNSDFQDDSDISEELDDEATNKLIQRRIRSSRNRRNAYMLPIEEVIKLNEDLYVEDNKLNCLLFFDEFCSGNPLSVGVGTIILAKNAKKDRINLVTSKIREYLSKPFFYGEQQVTIDVVKVLSDNYGLNQLLNTAKCRICDIEKRNFASFRSTQSANAPSSIRTNSFASGFTSSQGLVVDIFHDLDLGIFLTVLYEVIGVVLYECGMKKSRLFEILSYLTIQKKRANITSLIDKGGYIDAQFSEDIDYARFLNSRNRKRKIRANAVQSLSLLNSMIDLIRFYKSEFKLSSRYSGRKIIICYNLLKSVRRIRILANKEICNDDDAKLMDIYVDDYYKYKNFIIKNFIPTPKEHNLLHYGYLIRKNQGTKFMSTARFERFNSQRKNQGTKFMSTARFERFNSQLKRLVYNNYNSLNPAYSIINRVARKAYLSVKKSKYEERFRVASKNYDYLILYHKLYELLKKVDSLATSRSGFVRKFTFFTLIESFAKSPTTFHLLDEYTSDFNECNIICDNDGPRQIQFFSNCFQLQIAKSQNSCETEVAIENILTTLDEHAYTCTLKVNDHLESVAFFLVLLKKYFRKKCRVGEYVGQYNFLNVCLSLIGEGGALYRNYTVCNEVKNVTGELINLI